MKLLGTGTDRHGRVWQARIVSEEEQAEADFAFWQALTPEERVAAVGDCLLSALKAQGIKELPRIERVGRVVR